MSSTRKQLPPPIINRRLLVLAALLIALCVGLVAGSLVPKLVVFLVVVLLIVAGAVAFIAWDTWRKEYQAYVSRPVRAKRVKREVAQ